MNNSAKISSYQLFTLISCFVLGSTLVVNLAYNAGREAWLTLLIAIPVGIMLLAMYVYIAKLNPGFTLIEILNNNFGKILGKLIGILYIWYFIHLASLVLRNFGEFSIIVDYPKTPILFIIICFSVIVVLSVLSGIEVMGRISEIFLISITAIVIFSFFAMISESDIENFLPFMAHGIKPVIKSAFGTITFPFGETIAFLMIFPHLKKQKKLLKVSIYSVIFAGGILLIITIRNIMVLGGNMLTRDIFPSHIVFRLIPGLDIDPLLDINLITGGIIKVSVCIYAASKGLINLVNLDNYKPFVMPIVAIAVSLSIWVYESFMEMARWAGEIWPYYSIPFQIIFPFLLLVISIIKSKVINKHN